ncbi:hypothetical protein [Fimbriiglobus ruber]|uniref:hypothetical protein n=1 Tax=Fimbriiglobus ruber TaxID=1908690 RepID=UPI00137B46A5|nr:hypothetical protein [Fimbriiglobus ruber]
MDKTERLLQLARLRQDSRWPGYKPLSEYHGGMYECDFVSPYTKSASDANAKVMIMLQDWSSHDRLSGPPDLEAAEYGHTPKLPTNQRLKQLLQKHFNLRLDETYGTNLFPFIKTGSLSSSIPVRDLDKAAREFALPQIEIVEPHLVICLGLKTFVSLRRALGATPVKTLGQAITSPISYQQSRIWCQAHTGGLGQNNRNRGGIDRVSGDWDAMRIDVGM